VRLSGKDIAEKTYQALKERVTRLQKTNITPHLVVFLIGESPASIAYVNQKEKKGTEIGCKITVLRFDESVTTEELVKKVKLLNDDPFVHGILIQRPVPNHVDIDKLEMLTSSQKDIDGFHPDSPYTLPLPLAVVKILEEVYELETKHEQGVTRVGDPHRAPATNVRTSDGGNERQDPVEFWQDPERHKWLNSKNIIITGKGPTGGGPIIKHLKTLNITATVIDSKTPNPKELLKQADIIIAAIGRENMIKPEDLKQRVILIGVGILRGLDGKLHGDYNENEIESIASYYTPTPGGVGPVNVAMLMSNLVTAAEKQNKL
jgi:methylenetetrahydrofolate dehydrogenase (NADP+)/methenyltetrahydrofolate cyclohydrolase